MPMVLPVMLGILSIGDAQGIGPWLGASVCATVLRKGDVVRVEKTDIIPTDGEVIEGVAFVDESAITGESAPVLREPGTDMLPSREIQRSDPNLRLNSKRWHLSPVPKM
jgi:magnesium-transporting ATPase (P-type)